MRASLSRLLAAQFALILILLGGAAGVIAAPSLAPPAGWSLQVPPEVRDRARGWAESGGANLRVVASPANRDDFAEALVHLEVDAPLDPEALTRAALGRQVLAEVASATLGVSGAPVEFMVQLGQRPDTAWLRGIWEQDGTRYELAVGPSGASTQILVLAVRADEAALYRGVLDGALEQLADTLAPPVRAFPRRTVVLASWIAWVLLAGAAWGVAAATADRRGDHARNAHRVAQLLGVATLVALVVAWLAFGGYAEALARAHLTREWMALQVAAGGLVLAAVAFGVSRLAGRESRVRSAPSGSIYAARPGVGLPRLYDPNAPAESNAPPTEPRSSPTEPAPLPAGRDEALPVGARMATPHASANLADPADSRPLTTDAAGKKVAKLAIPRRVVRDETPIPSESFHGTYQVKPREASKATDSKGGPSAGRPPPPPGKGE